MADARSAARSFARPGGGEASSTERRLVSLTRRQTSRGGIGGTLDSLERARAATKQAVELLRAAKAAEREAWNQRAGDDEARPEDERRASTDSDACRQSKRRVLQGAVRSLGSSCAAAADPRTMTLRLGSAWQCFNRSHPRKRAADGSRSVRSPVPGACRPDRPSRRTRSIPGPPVWPRRAHVRHRMPITLRLRRPAGNSTSRP